MSNAIEKDPYVNLARQAIDHWFRTHSVLDPDKQACPADFFKRKAGVFVSLHSETKNLRGCVGTYLPTKENLAQEIISSAISAAFCDTRFQPLDRKEFASTKIQVSILSRPENIESLNKLDPKKYGVIVRSKEGLCGLLLPGLEGIDTPEEQVRIAGQKCGLDTDTEPYRLSRFTIEKHAS